MFPATQDILRDRKLATSAIACMDSAIWDDVHVHCLAAIPNGFAVEWTDPAADICVFHGDSGSYTDDDKLRKHAPGVRQRLSCAQ